MLPMALAKAEAAAESDLAFLYEAAAPACVKDGVVENLPAEALRISAAQMRGAFKRFQLPPV